MYKPVLTIFYQFNPWNPTIGGIQTLIGNFIKYAPSTFDVRLVGTGADTNQTRKGWQEAEFAGREISFLPLLTIENDNIRGRIPTTVKYASALLGRCYESDFMHFHRLEPTLATMNWRGDKTLFIHNDIQTQIQGEGNKKSILWRRFPAAYYALEGTLIRQFAEILSCNNNAVKSYQQRYPQIADRVAYIKNTFDSEIFFPLTPEAKKAQRKQFAQQLGLTEDRNFLLFAGRLHPQKDPILLINAFAALKEPNTHLLIAGDGELASQMTSEISRLGLSERVTMLGATAPAQLANLYRICSAFVLTSAYEGLPLVVLEALASGTPIVTTDCGETPEFLRSDSGIVCSLRTPDCVADALTKILRHPEDYPSDACVKTAAPYAAKNVVGQVYSQMFYRWESRVSSNHLGSVTS
jgi:glycosyltransferase involved in cell wall biosynthesis